MTEHSIHQSANADDTRTLLTVREACDRLRISHWSLYQLIRSRRIETIRIGRRRFVTAHAIQTLLEQLASEEAG